MSLWESAASALKPKRPPTDLERQAIVEVLTMATEYVQLPAERQPAYLAEIALLTSPRQRFLAVAFTDLCTAGWDALMTVLEALVQTEHGVVTRHGWFDQPTIESASGRLITDDGGELLQFPDATGLYRAPGQRGPTIGRFATANVVERRSAEWWEQKGETA